MNIEKETFDKLIELGWTPPPEKPKKYELSKTGYRITYMAEVVKERYNKQLVENGFTRETTESAQLAATRMRQMMHLSALAAELGGEKEFVNGIDNWAIVHNGVRWTMECTISKYIPERVYMTKACAIQIYNMIENGEFEL